MRLKLDIDPDLVAMISVEVATVLNYLKRFIAVWNESERFSQAA